MDSFFFNLTDTGYKVTELMRHNREHVKRVDIANGLVFFDIALALKNHKTLTIDNQDRMLILITVLQGKACITDNYSQNCFSIAANETHMFVSSKQALTVNLSANKSCKVFILFISDFFLKRYITTKPHEPIDYLYNKMQAESSFEQINQISTDAISLHLIKKITDAQASECMQSIITEHKALEYMIHQFSLLNITVNHELSPDEIRLAKQAKDIIVKQYLKPPSIKALAHLCATNDCTLKRVFKKAHHSTIYAFIQKLRLTQANQLLRETNLNVTEIAHAVGYKHSGHFSAIFFKSYGIYPKELKNSVS